MEKFVYIKVRTVVGMGLWQDCLLQSIIDISTTDIDAITSYTEQDLLAHDALQKPPEPMSILESEFCPNTIFTRIERQIFGYEGGEYISEADEFQLIIPEGATPKSTHVTIQFGVSSYIEFKECFQIA